MKKFIPIIVILLVFLGMTYTCVRVVGYMADKEGTNSEYQRALGDTLNLTPKTFNVNRFKPKYELYAHTLAQGVFKKYVEDATKNLPDDIKNEVADKMRKRFHSGILLMAFDKVAEDQMRYLIDACIVKFNYLDSIQMNRFERDSVYRAKIVNEVIFVR